MAVRGGGVEVEGLAGMIRALGKVDKAYRKEAVGVFRDAAKDVQGRAQAQVGRLGRYPTKRGMIGRSATGQGAGVKLRAAKYPWADGAEYGEMVAQVYGNPVGQSRMKRRTMPVFNPPNSKDLFKNTGGYMIQPAIRRRLPHWEKEAGERLMDITGRAMRRQGVKVASRG